MRPPKILGYPKEVLFRVIRPLYSIPEAGVHSFHTYHCYLKTQLQMKPSTFDMCPLFTQPCLQTDEAGTNDLRGIVCLQTDDTAYLGNDEFIQKEELVRNQFDTKEKKFSATIKQ